MFLSESLVMLGSLFKFNKMVLSKEVIEFLKGFNEKDGVLWVGDIYFVPVKTTIGKKQTEYNVVENIPEELKEHIHPIELAFKAAKKSLNKLTDLVNSTDEYTWDRSEIIEDSNGRRTVLNLKGTAPQITKYNKELSLVLKNFAEIEREYIEFKKRVQTKANQQLTKGQQMDW